MRRELQVVPMDGYPPDIGRWLWALEDARRITHRAVAGPDVATLDPLEDHLARLERSREVLLTQMREMSLDDFRRLRAPDGVDYEVTPEWAIYHLIEHEAGNAYQMRSLRRRAPEHVGIERPGRSR